MNARMQEMSDRLNAYLERRSVPMHLSGKPGPMQAEISALLRVVMKFAPRVNYVEWWNRVEDQISLSLKTRGWPSEAEIASAARSIVDGSKRPAEGDEVRRIDAMAGRMAEGLPVGDECFYGRMAVEMKAEGLVTEDVLRSYRSAWYFRAKKVYEAHVLQRMEARMLKRQADAEALAKSDKQSSARPPEPPAKRVKGYAWDGAV